MSDPYTGFVTIRGDQFVMADNPDRIVKLKGSNFQTVSTPWAMFAKWDEGLVDRTMDLCQDLGCNCLRWFVQLGHPERWELWEAFKSKAADRGMRIYGSFEWQHKYAAAGTDEFAADRDALIEVLTKQADDPRVVAYDIINEPEWIAHGKWHWKFDEEVGKQRLDWLLRIADIIHEHDSRHPVTIGFIFNYTWWTPEWARVLLDKLDFVDFHYYHRTYHRRGVDTAIQEVKAETSKPIVMGEFGQSSDPDYSVNYEEVHNEDTQRELYEHAMAAVQAEDVVGCLQWSTCAHNDEPREAGENEYGIYRQDLTPKPAAEVFRDAMTVPRFA